MYEFAFMIPKWFFWLSGLTVLSLVVALICAEETYNPPKWKVAVKTIAFLVMLVCMIILVVGGMISAS